ncbi:hypothetical protein RhiirA5_427276 [Rhizophagus irregularis]|uniref:Uncharacterized protein n=1 Tax=Rhizophagus irregularis TaxID=588596 RepID=A0A2N0P2N3_9GLOM|nr:hypothetical protein RhiirA5_427276 [Rhizophagus irregularis]PKC63797.1 hypothetical protein RhiirA1_463275 [Rhizophagus irregularis]CAB4486586.1 unnamed protein product [Rhizophagus irregularis]CAB5206796.1 unnamed protein product [Rhizophagus irregularis]CAB5378074.1 unnamed protein product [Rhizophagus irregularis]
MFISPATVNPVATIMQRQLIIKGRFFHSTPKDKNFFLITYKIIQENSNFFNENDPDYNLNYDYEFLYSYYTTNYYVRCKLLPDSIIEDLLNNEKFDMNTQNNEIPLSPQQKLCLEESLYIKLYLRISQGTDEIILITS